MFGGGHKSTKATNYLFSYNSQEFVFVVFVNLRQVYMVFQKIGAILPKNIKRSGISRQVEASIVCGAVDKELIRIFGEELGNQARALYYRDKTLTLAVLSSVLAQEIRFREGEILDFLDDKFGPQVVEKIRYLM